MTRIDDRLKRLEAIARLHTAGAVSDADRVERRRILSCLANDPEAMTAYNDWLTAISRVECRHRACGACWPCQRVDAAVHAAWEAYQARMQVVHHQHKENPS